MSTSSTSAALPVTVPHSTTVPCHDTPADLAPVERWLGDLRNGARAPLTWLLEGYVAPGNITLLTSQWKAGKTSLLSVLLARLGSGGTLAGLKVANGTAAVITEEEEDHWLRRADKLGYGDHICWFCHPFQGKPNRAQWQAILDRIVAIHARRCLSLVVIDPLSAFLPVGAENSADRMFEFLATLRPLTSRGLAVLILHHPGKRELGPGLAARGSGALSSYVDILIEMRWHLRASDVNRRRRLLGFSRHDGTPRQRVIELSADGTDYISHGNFSEEEFATNWCVLQGVLEVAREKLTRQQIAKGWPPDLIRPPRSTLYRWLDLAVTQGLVQRDGTGWRGKPYRYWLPGQEAKWPDKDRDLEILLAQIEAANAHVVPQPSRPLPAPESY